MGAFWRTSTELVMLWKSLLSSDYFSRYRSSKKVILGRQVISCMLQYRGPHAENEQFFSENIPKDTTIPINNKTVNINLKKVMTIWVVKKPKSFFLLDTLYICRGITKVSVKVQQIRFPIIAFKTRMIKITSDLNQRKIGSF